MGPATIILVGIIGGVGAAATYAAFNVAEKTGDSLTLDDLRPSLPWEGLPLPRFVYTKPELLSDLRRQ